MRMEQSELTAIDSVCLQGLVHLILWREKCGDLFVERFAVSDLICNLG
jgi:hypothetical protein